MTRNRLTVYLGIFLAVMMALSTIIPLLGNQVPQQQQEPTTPTPRPTVPPPISDLSSIQFTETYLHPSGLFTAAIPTGWVPVNEFNTPGEVQVTMNNGQALSVVEIRILRPVGDLDLSSPEGLNTVFTSAWLQQSWRDYNAWLETDRKIEEDRHIIDFNLQRQGQDFIARQVSYSDGTWIYVFRVVTPSNASSVLRHVLQNEIESFSLVERFVGAPMEWNATYDEVNQHLIRYPGDWQLTDYAPGSPISVNGPTGVLRVETSDALIDSPAAASDYVEGLRSGITILSVEEVDLFGTPGYRVAYTLATPDGSTQSGLVVMMTDEDGTLHTANVRLTAVEDTDLNAIDPEAPETPLEQVQALEITETFSLLPELQLASNDS